MKVYIIKQVLAMRRGGDVTFVDVLFGYTMSYHVVRWFGRHDHMFHYGNLVVFMWEVCCEEDLLENLKREFVLEDHVNPKLYYLELVTSCFGIKQMPLYINQSIDVSGYVCAIINVLEENMSDLVHLLLFVDVSKNDTLVTKIVRALQLLRRYIGDDRPELYHPGIEHFDDKSLLMDMVEYDDEGYNGYYGY